MKIHSPKKAWGIVALGLCLPPATHAAEIEWGGFLSLVGGKTLDDNTTYDVGAFGQPRSVYQDDISFTPDSVLGLQGQTQITDKLRATVQLLGRGGGSMNGDIEWAYLSYDFSDKFQINAGKFRLPLYYYSDFLDVGYTYYWVRPPAELYGGPSSVIGVNTFYADTAANVDYTIQAWYGSNTFDANETFGPTVSEMETYDSWGITMFATYDWMSFRFVYHETGLKVDEINLDQNITQIGFAYLIDYNNFMLRTELTRLDLGSTGFETAWYVSAGYNFDGITPHITYTDHESSQVEVMTYGISYDVYTNMKLKLEYSDQEDTSGNNSDTQLLTVGVDMVF